LWGRKGEREIKKYEKYCEKKRSVKLKKENEFE